MLEIFFLDVGQGSSSIIYLGQGEAIVVDCGKARPNITIQVLKQLKITTIKRLIVSHNHNDHCAGAAAILTAFRGKIEEIWAIDDTSRRGNKFWLRIQDDIKKNYLDSNQIVRLEMAGRPKILYRSPKCSLDLYFPTFTENLEAIDSGDPNIGSAVILLRAGQKKVLFTSDTSISSWRHIRNRLRAPIGCDIVTVPHHGGGIWRKKSNGEDAATFQRYVQSEVEWLFSNCIAAKHAIISVGTGNRYGHPREEVVKALRRVNVVVLCTQLTTQCCNDLEAFRHARIPGEFPAMSDAARHGRDVGCAGTISAVIDDTAIAIRRIDVHRQFVNSLPLTPNAGPLCRRP